MSDDQLKKTIAVYNTIADQYAKSVESYYSAIDRDKFLLLISKGGKILDAGCAAGRDSRYFDSLGYDVVGVDLSQKLLDIAKKKAPYIDFQQQDIRSLPFPPNSFDGIYATAVLLHLDRDEVLPILKQFHTLLKPGGVVCVQVKEGIGEADVKEPISEGKARHFTYFKKDEMESLLTQAGFTMNRTTRYNERDINPKWRDIFWINCLAQKQRL